MDGNFLLSMLQKGQNYNQIAEYYQNIYPGIRGFSARSFRRYCKLKGMTRPTEEKFTRIMHYLASNYRHFYRIRMMQVSISSLLGITSGSVSQRGISKVLKLLAPATHQARGCETLEMQNPVPYFGPYYGYKVHLDQNVNFGQDYGCTYKLLIDGCSMLIVGCVSMPVENPILIYEIVFRKTLLKYGIWD